MFSKTAITKEDFALLLTKVDTLTNELGFTQEMIGALAKAQGLQFVQGLRAVRMEDSCDGEDAPGEGLKARLGY